MGKGTLDGAHTYRDGLMALSASGLGYTYLREGKSDPALAAYVKFGELSMSTQP